MKAAYSDLGARLSLARRHAQGGKYLYCQGRSAIEPS